MLNTVVLSDLHFGEPYNLAHDQGVPPILNLIKAHARGRVRRLVLAGDIFEMSTPESMELVRRQARFFFKEARGRFQMDEIVWVPGNHDYTLFRRHFPRALTTDPRGEAAPKELVEEYFGEGFPVPVRVAYPHLLLRAPRQGRAWVIHHGHYLDDIVLGQSARDRARAFFSALGGGSLVQVQPVPMDGSLSLPQIEERVRPLLEGIWCHHADPNNFQNEVWDLVRRWGDYISCLRPEPGLELRDEESAILNDHDLGRATFYLRALQRDAQQALAPGESVTLVFGHTHGGGIHLGSFEGRPLRLLNLGGWIPGEKPTRAGRQAHTHVYLINDDLQDRLLTAPFSDEWVNRCLQHGRSVFAIPGPDDELIEAERSAPPAAGMSVDEMLRWQDQHPLGDTRASDDPFQRPAR